MGNRKHLLVDYETYDMITKNCVEEFLNHHPEFIGMKLTQSFIIRKIAEFYLNS